MQIMGCNYFAKFAFVCVVNAAGCSVLPLQPLRAGGTVYAFIQSIGMTYFNI